MRKIMISVFLLFLSGCATISQEEACTVCMSAAPCQAPPELQIPPQQSLSLPTPEAKLVKPAKGKPYFVLTENDFYLWIDNNHRIEEFIRECRNRVDMTKEYYEISLEPLRLR